MSNCIKHLIPTSNPALVGAFNAIGILVGAVQAFVAIALVVAFITWVL